MSEMAILQQFAFLLLLSCALGSRMIGANMQRELFIALQLKVAHHLIERFAGRRAGRVEDPSAFGTTKTLKMRLLNPFQRPVHVLVRTNVV
jgi:hypothetical protein